MPPQTSRKYDPASLARNSRELYRGRNIPAQMPILKGNGSYALVAIICGTTWEYGQYIHNANFYQELLRHAAKGQQFRITSLRSIHHIILAESVLEYRLPTK